MGTAFLHRRVTILDLGKSWFMSFFGNLAGMLFFCIVIKGCEYHYNNFASLEQMYFHFTGCGWLSEPRYKGETFKFAQMELVDPQWHQIFLRAIGDNWLVCMAVWLSTPARETVSKNAAI